jgi:hypothetical protein
MLEESKKDRRQVELDIRDGYADDFSAVLHHDAVVLGMRQSASA